MAKTSFAKRKHTKKYHKTKQNKFTKYIGGGLLNNE